MPSSPVTGPGAGAGAGYPSLRRTGPGPVSRPQRADRAGRSEQTGRAQRPGATTPTPTVRRDEAPSLHLVGTDVDTVPRSAQSHTRPITEASDPRWVLALRTAELLEGTILTPEKRQRLIRTGRLMGLNVFDCNLVIAIVQDQARRGHSPSDCPAAGVSQLAMVPLPHHAGILAQLRQRPGLLVGGIVVTMILAELALLRWLF